MNFLKFVLKYTLITFLVLFLVLVVLLSYIFYDTYKFNKWSNKVTKEAKVFLYTTFQLNKSKKELVKLYNLKYLNTEQYTMNQYSANRYQISIEMWGTSKDLTNNTQIIYGFNNNQVKNFEYIFFSKENLIKEQVFELLNTSSVRFFQALFDDELRYWQIGSFSNGIGIWLTNNKNRDNIKYKGYSLIIDFGENYKFED